MSASIVHCKKEGEKWNEMKCMTWLRNWNELKILIANHFIQVSYDIQWMSNNRMICYSARMLLLFSARKKLFFNVYRNTIYRGNCIKIVSYSTKSAGWYINTHSCVIGHIGHFFHSIVQHTNLTQFFLHCTMHIGCIILCNISRVTQFE